jgi:hypothetical protein
LHGDCHALAFRQAPTGAREPLLAATVSCSELHACLLACNGLQRSRPCAMHCMLHIEVGRRLVHLAPAWRFAGRSQHTCTMPPAVAHCHAVLCPSAACPRRLHAVIAALLLHERTRAARALRRGRQLPGLHGPRARFRDGGLGLHVHAGLLRVADALCWTGDFGSHFGGTLRQAVILT